MRKLDSKTIIVASHNREKINEILTLKSPLGFSVESAAGLNFMVPAETGETFEENAILKALMSARISGLPALSDDSGLVVNALDGQPGVHSARWAEAVDGRRDFSMAIEKLESALLNKGATTLDLRSACFVSILCLAWPDGHVETFSGVVEGTIVWPPRRRFGFGYDPVSQPKGFCRTFGEMTSEEKNAFKTGQREEPLSHRARAFKRFVEGCL